MRVPLSLRLAGAGLGLFGLLAWLFAQPTLSFVGLWVLGAAGFPWTLRVWAAIPPWCRALVASLLRALDVFEGWRIATQGCPRPLPLALVPQALRRWAWWHLTTAWAVLVRVARAPRLGPWLVGLGFLWGVGCRWLQIAVYALESRTPSAMVDHFGNFPPLRRAENWGGVLVFLGVLGLTVRCWREWLQSPEEERP